MSDGESLADQIARNQREEDAENLAWSGDYDGTECPNCGRVRVIRSNNGKRRCEKCNWDPDAGEYSAGPHIG